MHFFSLESLAKRGGRGYKLGLTAAVRKARGGVPGGAFGGDTKESERERERERERES